MNQLQQYNEIAYLIRQNGANFNKVVNVDLKSAAKKCDDRLTKSIKKTNVVKVRRQLVDNEKKHIGNKLYECDIIETQLQKKLSVENRQSKKLAFLQKIGRR
jgi:outer membrane lipopolysaccharide assembly protein LptE/RlpB